MALENLAVGNTYQIVADTLGVSVETAVIILTVVAIWELVWTGLAMWKSAQRKNVIWFIVFLVINFFGILEILYIYVFSEIGEKKSRAIMKSQKAKRKK